MKATGLRLRTVSFALRSDLYDELKKHCPRYGDRSKILQLLVEMFVKGEIKLQTEGRTF